MTGIASLHSAPLMTIDVGDRTHIASEECWCSPIIRSSDHGGVTTVEEIRHQFKVADRVAARVTTVAVPGQRDEEDQLMSDLADRIESDFTYHPPKDGQIGRYSFIRAVAKTLALDIIRVTPASREQSLALTKLEEVVMWANAAIARHES